MFRYANPYDFEPRVAEGDQVDYMDIVQGVDEFDGQDVETEDWRLNSMLWCTCQTSFFPSLNYQAPSKGILDISFL